MKISKISVNPVVALGSLVVCNPSAHRLNTTYAPWVSSMHEAIEQKKTLKVRGFYDHPEYGFCAKVEGETTYWPIQDLEVVG